MGLDQDSWQVQNTKAEESGSQLGIAIHRNGENKRKKKRIGGGWESRYVVSSVTDKLSFDDCDLVQERCPL